MIQRNVSYFQDIHKLERLENENGEKPAVVRCLEKLSKALNFM